MSVIYFSYDADSAGSKIGRAVLADDLKGIKEMSEKIHAGNQLVYAWAKEREGIQYSSGGDQGVYAIPKKYEDELEGLRKDYEYLTGLTISVGTGKYLSESGQALLMAKLKGKNRIINYNDETKKEIEAIKKKVKKGKYNSMEEYKLGSAYLEKSEQAEDDCPYCQQSDGTDSDHCKYCHDAETQADEEGCKFCEEEAALATDIAGPDAGIDEQDCPFCQEEDALEQDEDCPFCAAETQMHPDGPGTSPDSNNDQAPAGSEDEKALYEKMGMNPPIIGKRNPAEEPPIGQNAPMDTVPKEPAGDLPADNTALPQTDGSAPTSIDPEDNHSKEALQAIAQQIEQEGTVSTGEVNAIDDSSLPMGQQVEQNISRPEDYGQNQPQDMGLDSVNSPDEQGEEPDMSSILQEGLDHESDGIQKERAIQMISSALSQFRAAKNDLEAAKVQNPRLYQASLGILKAMIEMAGFLGLGDGQPSAAPALGEEQQELMPPPGEESENDWHNPFPTHPDFGGEAKPGHAPSENNPEQDDDSNGTIGQSIGKLSAKHTTKHIARTPMSAGAINGKGQQKVVDATTGKTRWIDRKQGMVQNSKGIPVKPPTRGGNESQD